MSRIIEKDENYYKITAFKQREDYISTISHDLKIPIIAQIRALEILSEGCLGKLNSEQKEMIDLTLESCKSIYEMLGAIITSYKYENKKVPLIFAPVNLQKIFDTILYEQKTLLERKNININIKIKASNITADKKQFTKALENIIQYCLYSTTSNSTISINTQTRNDIFQILINFCPLNNFENFSEKFLNNNITLEKIGNNLNLHLAKQLIDAHEGFISIKQAGKNCLIIVNILNKN